MLFTEALGLAANPFRQNGSIWSDAALGLPNAGSL
jgi:hypothetical protein